MIRITAAIFGLISALLLAGSTRTGAAELLANGGFEQGAAGWSTTAGLLDAVGSPVLSGASAARFSGSGQPTTHVAYQWTNVQPGEEYELSGWASMSGGGLSRLFLQINWFDTNGNEVAARHPSYWLPLHDGTFYFLTTGRTVSPQAARQARVSVYVQAESSFEAHFDDLAFSGPAAIPPPPTTIAPPPTPPPPAVTPTPRAPATTPTRTPRRTVTPVRTPAPQNPGDTPAGDPTTATEEPTVFQQLVNEGFEELRPDGTPFGWRKQGGEMTAVHEPKTEGSRAAALTSQTTSTKWIYQTVSIRGGAHYMVSVDAQAGTGSESVFLRLSWYASADGSGSAIDSVDSLESVSPAEAGFKTLSTGVVEAPAGAGTVKVRLMLRPASEAPAAAHFDAVSLVETTADVQVARRSGGGSGAFSRAGTGVSADPAAETGEEQRLSGGTPVSLANVKPEKRDEAAPVSSGGGGSDEWAILLAIGIATTAIAIGGGHELWQRRHRGEPNADDI